MGKIYDLINYFLNVKEKVEQTKKVTPSLKIRNKSWKNSLEHITRDVTWSDVIKSQTAANWKINNSLPVDFKQNAITVATKIIQPIFDKFGVGYISSFFRCPRLNRKIKGSFRSWHKKAKAVDLDGFKSNMVVADWIRNNLEYDKLIYEKVDDNGEPEWIHISFNEGKNRKIALVYDGKKYYKYTDYYEE